MDAPRLKEVVCFTYRPACGERFVVPHLVAGGAIDAKELVFKLTVHPRTSLDDNGRAWAFSTILSSAYAYSPSAEPGAVVRLPGIRLCAPAETIGMAPVRWAGPGTSPGELVDEVWTIRSAPTGAAPGEDLQAARMWERR